jgi:hypothetical protein
MALKGLSTAELQKELKRRKKGAEKLLARRARLLADIQALDTEIEDLTGGKPGENRRGPALPDTGRKRARNDMSLPDAIAKAMDVRAVVSPKEAAELVRRNGFKTTSKNFNMMVSNALAKDKRFKRIGRGQYERTN